MSGSLLASADVEERRQRLRVVIIVGTRPEAIKLFPVIQALRDSPVVEPFVVTTGQHLELCTDVLKMAGITIDRDLHVVRETGTINELAAQVLSHVGSLLEELCWQNGQGQAAPVFAAVVHGDTTSALAGALAAAQAGVPVVHIEAGLRTYNPRSPFPEELNRTLISRIAAVQVAPTGHNEANLVREGIREGSVHISGNTSIDSLMWATQQPVHWTSVEIASLVQSGTTLVVATLHRRENWPRLAELAGALALIAKERPDIHIVVPLHPNPQVQASVRAVLEGVPNVHLTDAMGYIEFAHVLKAATLVITDSGGIQEEAPSVGTPVIVARHETERQEGVDAGTLLLAGDDPQDIARHALTLLSPGSPELVRMKQSENPYGDGRAAVRIRELLEYLVSGGRPPSSWPHVIDRAAVLKSIGYRDLAVAFRHHSEDDRVESLVEQVGFSTSGRIAPESNTRVAD